MDIFLFALMTKIVLERQQYNSALVGVVGWQSELESFLFFKNLFYPKLSMDGFKVGVARFRVKSKSLRVVF